MSRDTTLKLYTETLNDDLYCGFSYGHIVVKNVSSVQYDSTSS